MKKDLMCGVFFAIHSSYTIVKRLQSDSETHYKFLYMPVNMRFPPNHCTAGDK